nr:hypothetical protein [Tanacetum cinerariifolium]
MFDCDDYFSSESDCESWPPSSLYDRFQPSGGYHVVPPPSIGTFMPPKLDLPVETSIPTATPTPASLKSASSGKKRNRKAFFVCKSVDHLIKDCDYHAKKMAQPTPRNYAHRGNYKQYASLTHTHPQKHMVPTALLNQSKPVFNTAVRPVSAAMPKINVTRPRYAHPIVTKSKSPIRRHITHSPSQRPEPKCPILDHVSRTTSASMTLKRFDYNDALGRSKSVMAWVPKENLTIQFVCRELNGGYVAFGGNPKGGKISGKGKLKTSKLDFDDVYFVKELKFNLFSVSQMCDKKNSVLFTDTECLVLSPVFKLPDESQVLLRVPRENNMYNVNLKNIVPSGDLTCLFAKAKIDESNLWHRMLGHINFKTINKLVKQLLLEDYPQMFLKMITPVLLVRKASNIEPLVRPSLTLIEAARTMLTDSLLPIPFWTEVVNTACYVQNRVLVTKPYNKTPYELLHGRTPSIGFMRPFGCPMTILNTLDPLGKFEGKVDEGFLVGYSVSSKAFRVFNSRTRIVQLHGNFLENKPNVVGSGPTWLFDIDSLTRTMNYQPVNAGNQTNPSAGFQHKFDAEKAGEEVDQQYVLFPMWSSGSTNPQNNDGDAAFDGKEHDFDAKKPESEVNVSSSSSAQSRKQDDKTKKEAKGNSPVESFTRYKDLSAEFEDCSNNSSNEVNAVGSIVLTVGQNFPNSTNTFSAAAPSNVAASLTYVKSSFIDASQLPDDSNMLERNPRGYINLSKIQVGLKLCRTSFFNLRCRKFRTIEEEVYVYQPPGFEDPNYPDKVYKVVKALYGLHQAPRAWYETLANYLLENGFQRGKIDQTLFIKKRKGDILLQKKDGIFISQDKYVAEILRKFRLTEGKSSSTPIDTEKPLLKDPNVKRIFRYLKGKPHLGLWYPKDSPFDLVAYSDSDYAGTSLDRKSTTRGCQFIGCRLISWQCKKQTVIATSSTEAEYVVAASFCAQVLWIQNQLMDY